MANNIVPDGLDINETEANNIYMEMIQALVDEVLGDGDRLTIVVKDGDIVTFDIDDPESLTEEQNRSIDEICSRFAMKMIAVAGDIAVKNIDRDPADGASGKDNVDAAKKAVDGVRLANAADIIDDIRDKAREMSFDTHVLARAVSILGANDQLDVDGALDTIKDNPSINALVQILSSHGGIVHNTAVATQSVGIEKEILDIMAHDEKDVESYYCKTLAEGLSAMARAHMAEEKAAGKPAKPVKDFVPEGSPDHNDESPDALGRAWQLICDEHLDEYTDIARISAETNVPERVVKTMIDKARQGA